MCEADQKVGEEVAVPVVFIYGALCGWYLVSILTVQLNLSGIKFLTC
jgi:tetrahydromethanopterin S-methyltransferase subunit G